MKFQEMYSNFDALDVSLQASPSREFLGMLEGAKALAQKAKADAPLLVKGRNGEDYYIQVAPSGVSGGYKYQFHTGQEGEIWFLKDAPEADKNGEASFNIRCSVRAFQLARCGIEQAKDNILRKARDFGARVKEDDIRISRVDFAIDFLAPEFVLDPDAIIARGSQSERLDDEGFKPSDVSLNRFNRKYSTVTVGKMPRRQVCIYNKRREVITKQKKSWWDIWGLKQDDPENVVWRVELRAGKEHLQDKFNIRTFSDLRESAGALFADMMEVVRYVVPNENDQNVSRWGNHEIWVKAKNALLRYAKEGALGFERGRVTVQNRKRVLNIYEKMILGMVSGYSEIKEIECDENALKKLLKDIEKTYIKAFLSKEGRAKVIKTRRRVRDRYIFELGGKNEFEDHAHFAKSIN